MVILKSCQVDASKSRCYCYLELTIHIRLLPLEKNPRDRVFQLVQIPRTHLKARLPESNSSHVGFRAVSKVRVVTKRFAQYF